MKRASFAAVLVVPFVLAGCASEGAGGGAGYYGDAYFYGDWWYGYGGACCIDYPGDIGPPGPHPEHPIAGGPRPEHPIATPPKAEVSPSRSMPSPRPSAPMRGGGGGGRGGGGRR